MLWVIAIPDACISAAERLAIRVPSIVSNIWIFPSPALEAYTTSPLPETAMPCIMLKDSPVVSHFKVRIPLSLYLKHATPPPPLLVPLNATKISLVTGDLIMCHGFAGVVSNSVKVLSLVWNRTLQDWIWPSISKSELWIINSN